MTDLRPSYPYPRLSHPFFEPCLPHSNLNHNEQQDGFHPWSSCCSYHQPHFPQISNNPFITTTLQTSYKIRCTSLWWPRSGWLDFQNLPILRLSRIIRPWATYSCIILYGWTRLVLVPMDDPQWVYHVLVGRVIGSQIAICPHLLWWPTWCTF